MKKTLLALAISGMLLAWTTSCSNQSETKQIETPALIPAPQKLTTGTGSFQLSANSAITFDQSNEELMAIARYFNEKTKPALGFGISVEKHGKIKFLLDKNASLGNEGYHLQVKHSDIILTATKPAGIFYGVQTLLQLLPAEIKGLTTQSKDFKWTIPCTDITDQPQFAWRGLMLDVSRHWFTKDEVKNTLTNWPNIK